MTPAAFGLREHIELKTAVEHAHRLDGGGWELQISDGSRRRFDALVVANGHHWNPPTCCPNRRRRPGRTTSTCLPGPAPGLCPSTSSARPPHTQQINYFDYERDIRKRELPAARRRVTRYGPVRLAGRVEAAAADTV